MAKFHMLWELTEFYSKYIMELIVVFENHQTTTEGLLENGLEID